MLAIIRRVISRCRRQKPAFPWWCWEGLEALDEFDVSAHLADRDASTKVHVQIVRKEPSHNFYNPM